MRQIGGRASRAVAAMAPVSAVAVTAAAQVYVARRRFGRLVVAAGGIDLTVHPDGTDAADEPAIELLALGDSSTAGIGVDRVEDTLPVLIASRLALGTGRPVHVLSHGRSGARTRDVIREQLPLVTTRPDVAVLVIGTNDVTKLTRTRVLCQETRYLLWSLNDLGIPVIMCSLPELRAMSAIPPLARIGLEIKAFRVRRAQADAARTAPDCRLVDVRRMVGHEFIGNDAYLSADRFHPSAVGYARIADALAPALVTRLGLTSLQRRARESADRFGREVPNRP